MKKPAFPNKSSHVLYNLLETIKVEIVKKAKKTKFNSPSHRVMPIKQEADGYACERAILRMLTTL